ncbi:MAG: hypothetical protein RR215_04345, partial [Ruthenibacterium sp.]
MFTFNFHFPHTRRAKAQKKECEAGIALPLFGSIALQQSRFRLRGKKAGKNGSQSGGGRSPARTTTQLRD